MLNDPDRRVYLELKAGRFEGRAKGLFAILSVVILATLALIGAAYGWHW